MITHSTSRIRFPEWQEEYEAALLDGERLEISKRVTDAEYAIFMRLQDLADFDQPAERHAIEDALKHLLFIKQEKLGFPRWQK